MLIKELELNETKNISCKYCGRKKGLKDNKKSSIMIYGIWNSNNEKPDYMMCKSCMNKLLSLVAKG